MICVCGYVYRLNENIENGLKSFFCGMEDYLPFSIVRLVKVPVHSGGVSCTFSPHFSQMPLCSCTFGFWSCTIGVPVRLVTLVVLLVAVLCAVGYTYCTLG